MTCEFKYCKGPNACFLKDISPCPGACRSEADEETTAPRDRVRSRGFVDREALARVLLEDHPSTPVQSIMNVERVSSKFLRAVEVMGQRTE
ncbi:MAG: hypothetical protein AAGA06_07650 [Pseudomonadota bacterium]